jgi:hypothetical protein
MLNAMLILTDPDPFAFWKSLAWIVGGLGFAVGCLAFLIATWQARSEETWRKIAERRLTSLQEEKASKEEWKERCKSAELENDRLIARSGRERAKLEWYESRYGPVPPTDIHSSRSD